MNDADASHHRLIDPPSWNRGASPPESQAIERTAFCRSGPQERSKSKRAKIMHKNILTLALLYVPASTGALAHSGSDQKQKACTPDVERKLMDRGDFTILACLKENRPKLSTPCREVLVSHVQ
jgi:hypothetical protein